MTGFSQDKAREDGDEIGNEDDDKGRGQWRRMALRPREMQRTNAYRPTAPPSIHPSIQWS